MRNGPTRENINGYVLAYFSSWDKYARMKHPPALDIGKELVHRARLDCTVSVEVEEWN